MDEKEILVAKSYQGLPIMCDPYEMNGRQYVKVKLKSGNLKQVRVYSQKEYAKYNPPVKVIKPAKSRRDVLGFGEQGFIWLFKGKTSESTYQNLDWFRTSPCRYTRVWGWYLPSDIEMPDPIPVDVEPVKLLWDEVSFNGDLIPDDQIIQEVNNLIYSAGTSQHIGQIGDRIEIDAICTRAVINQGQFGISYFFVFTTDEGNIFTWSTSTRSLEEGQRYHIRGTLKEHTVFRNNCQNVLTRCKVEEIE